MFSKTLISQFRWKKKMILEPVVKLILKQIHEGIIQNFEFLSEKKDET